MRLRIQHKTVHRYSEPVRGMIRKLRLTPRNCNSQTVVDWRIETDRDCRLTSSEDAFGNIVHCFAVDGPFDSLTTLVEGVVETFPTAGVVQGAIERFPAELWLRDTDLTRADASLRAFAQAITARQTTTLSRLHELLAALHAVVGFDSQANDETTTAAEAFAAKSGGRRDFAHMFVACARAIGAPARCVSGYCVDEEIADAPAFAHFWAECLVENLGWVGFDAARGLTPGESCVRVAVALDCLGAAPIRGARTGGGGEEQDETVRIAQGQAQSQAQA